MKTLRFMIWLFLTAATLVVVLWIAADFFSIHINVVQKADSDAVLQEQESPAVSAEPEPAEPEPDDQQNETTHVIKPLSAGIWRMTNQVRVDGGLKPLKYIIEMQDAADMRAFECSVQFSHTRPNGSGCHTVVGEDYSITGENLIMIDSRIAYEGVIVAEWMLSSGHRANIMLPDYTGIAVGTYEKDGTTYACQIFIG